MLFSIRERLFWLFWLSKRKLYLLKKPLRIKLLSHTKQSKTYIAGKLGYSYEWTTQNPFHNIKGYGLNLKEPKIFLPPTGFSQKTDLISRLNNEKLFWDWFENFINPLWTEEINRVLISPKFFFIIFVDKGSEPKSETYCFPSNFVRKNALQRPLSEQIPYRKRSKYPMF